MRFDFDLAGPADERAELLVHAQHHTYCIAQRILRPLARSKQTCKPRPLPSENGTVRVWVTADAKTVDCFASQVSTDCGRTWRNSLDE